jgi:outer membrane immunogenic protein
VTIFQRVSQRMPWFGTVRARAGWSTGPALFYVTGGYAYGRVETDATLQLSIGPDVLSAGSVSFADNRSGWTAGAGLGAQLIGNWTGKIEYLYLDLGTTSGTMTIVDDPLAGTSTLDVRVRDHIFRAGLNYKFDWGPVVARY